MERKDELLKIFQELDGNVFTIVSPLIDDLVFIEAQLVELRKQPFVKCNPKYPSVQKPTTAGKLYKELLVQEKDIVRILCSQLHKNGNGEEESEIEKWLKSRGGT